LVKEENLTRLVNRIKAGGDLDYGKPKNPKKERKKNAKSNRSKWEVAGFQRETGKPHGPRGKKKSKTREQQ